MDLKPIQNPKDSNIYGLNLINEWMTPTGSNIYRKPKAVQYATPMGSYHSFASLSIIILSLRDKAMMQTLKTLKRLNKNK